MLLLAGRLIDEVWEHSNTQRCVRNWGSLHGAVLSLFIVVFHVLTNDAETEKIDEWQLHAANVYQHECPS
jgi:hypothetical protein